MLQRNLLLAFSCFALLSLVGCSKSEESKSEEGVNVEVQAGGKTVKAQAGGTKVTATGTKAGDVKVNNGSAQAGDVKVDNNGVKAGEVEVKGGKVKVPGVGEINTGN